MEVVFMEIKEKYNLEFKMEVKRTFLKTVSAYANYNDGEIMLIRVSKVNFHPIWGDINPPNFQVKTSAKNA